MYQMSTDPLSNILFRNLNQLECCNTNFAQFGDLLSNLLPIVRELFQNCLHIHIEITFCKSSLIDNMLLNIREKIIHLESDLEELLKRLIITLTNYN